VNANLSIRLKRFAFPAFLALASTALVGASCDKKSSANPEQNGVIEAADRVKVDTTPIPGVDLSKLEGDKDKEHEFYRLVDHLQSPCEGKVESLRKSVTDKACKRATFAVRIVVSLLADEAEPGEIEEAYNGHYKDVKAHSFNLDGVPHKGPTDAPVQLVEFLDFGCGVCKRFAPILKETLAEFPNEAVLYYKQFPLEAHPHSEGAAKAALAAQAQGKFKEMHDLLFEKAPRHQISELAEYAKQLGLDPDKFQRDFTAAAARVQADRAEGERADIRGTPALFINGREYTGPHHPRYVRMWIEEELAVNR
jgi:protein-disulfide isomerase